MWYLFILFLSSGLILEASKTFSMMSHGKVVMCTVAEQSVNNEYNLEEHDLNLCTHLIYFEKDRSPFHTIDSTKLSANYFDTIAVGPTFNRLPAIREKYPSLKVCFGVNDLPIDFFEMASNERKRNRFYKNAISYLLNSHFDGLDLNWNYEKQNFYVDEYVIFVKELKEYLQWNRLLLLIGITDETVNIDTNYLSILSHHYDYIHFTPQYPINFSHKTYSVTDALREHGSKHTESIINDLIENVVPSTKIVLGFNFGGPKFDTALRKTIYLGYNEICETISNPADEWTTFYDTEANLALAKKKDKRIDFWREIIVFLNTNSIIHRIRYGMKHNLAGIMAGITTDDLHGKCKNNEKYNDFASPNVNITLTMSDENNALPLLNQINLMMVMAKFAIEQETQQTDEDGILFLD